MYDELNGTFVQKMLEWKEGEILGPKASKEKKTIIVNMHVNTYEIYSSIKNRVLLP